MKEHFLASILTFYDEETEEWNSVALEMDIWGYGTTPEESFEDLNKLVCMQVSFALFKKQPGMIWHRADDIYWNLFEKARHVELIEHLGSGVVDVETGRTTHIGHTTDKERKYASGLPFPSPQVIEEKRKELEAV